MVFNFVYLHSLFHFMKIKRMFNEIVKFLLFQFWTFKDCCTVFMIDLSIDSNYIKCNLLVHSLMPLFCKSIIHLY